MFMSSSSPIEPAWLDIIDDASRGGAVGAVPLCLIHDGGGTIFQYCMFEQPLGRRTFGISNPYFGFDVGPKGGIPELAIAYTQALRQTIRRGRVILGGWSLGGMIALEMARILEHDRNLKVIGLLMIDSICPWSTLGWLSTLVSMGPCFRAGTQADMKAKVDRTFADARRMIRAWPRPAPFATPPAVLIRAKDTPFGVDRLLGWTSYESVKFVAIMDAEGNHFSMFDETKVSGLTQKLKLACALLAQ